MSDITNEPILERIADDLACAIGNAKTANGYRIDIRRVIRPDKNGIPSGLQHLDVLFGQLTDEAHNQIQSSFTEGRMVTFRCFVNILQSELDETPTDTYLNRVLADVRKAVHADRQRSGLAFDTVWGDTAFVIESGGLDGIFVDISVVYETSESDPYSL